MLCCLESMNLNLWKSTSYSTWEKYWHKNKTRDNLNYREIESLPQIGLLPSWILSVILKFYSFFFSPPPPTNTSERFEDTTQFRMGNRPLTRAFIAVILIFHSRAAWGVDESPHWSKWKAFHNRELHTSSKNGRILFSYKDAHIICMCLISKSSQGMMMRMRIV